MREARREAAGGALAGRVALVSGATRGIGRAIALALAREGAAVCVTGRNGERAAAVVAEIAAAGGRAMPLALDVTRLDEIRHAVDQTTARLGGLDIVVANAGIAAIGPVAEADPADWRAMMEVNYFGTAHLVQAALKPMLAQGRGDIVAIASSAGTTGYEDWAGYCASKYAVVGFMECLGREMVGKGIRVSTICPGSVDTPLWDDLNQPLHPAGSASRAAMMTAGDVAEIVLLQLRLPRTVLLKHVLTFPTNEWH
ncbi:MAG: SDR family oxidoreductase [Rhodospirillaceae bacterium]|nr:SDR family oxidoreductase [Rhodospirillaceae bacterium]